MIINNEKKKKYFNNIINFLKNEYKYKNIFPPKNKIFKAFKLTTFKKLKIIILGQDPYYKKKLADGLAFSVNKKTTYIPASLNNIYKEIKKEFPLFKKPNNGNLIHWAKQDILLLNSILTVEENKPLSHEYIGWKIFTNNILLYINYYLKNIIFLLWGKKAQEKKNIINKKKHKILCTSHPSTLSFNNGFKGCNHFKLCNIFLKNKNYKTINW